MKVVTKSELVNAVVDHPYDTNPDLIAKVSFFYFSEDRKLTMAYYESPQDWFDVKVSDFDEMDAILEGEVQLISDREMLTAKAGDCFLTQDAINSPGG